MGMQSLLTHIKPYADDIKKNIRKIFVEYDTPGLIKEEVWFIGLVVAYTLRNRELTDYFETYVLENIQNKPILDDLDTIKALITVMTVRNTYYKAILKSSDLQLEAFEFNISEEIMHLHEHIDNKRFHLYALASAAVSASSKCMQDEIFELRKQNVPNEAIHSVISIAAILKGASQALHMN